MAVLFLDKKLKESFPEEYQKTIEMIDIIHVNELERGIEQIVFKSDEFGSNEHIIARLQNNSLTLTNKF